MPIKNGLDATAELRQKGFKMPIVALTANALPSDKERCLTVQMNDVVTKPYVKSILIQTLKRFVPHFNR
jgi:two-component system, sensor histidine kinase